MQRRYPAVCAGSLQGLTLACMRLCTQIQSTDGSSTQCISAIIPGGDAQSIILGDNFMRAMVHEVYTYDIKKKTAYVGFGEAAAMTASTG